MKGNKKKLVGPNTKNRNFRRALMESVDAMAPTMEELYGSEQFDGTASAKLDELEELHDVVDNAYHNVEGTIEDAVDFVKDEVGALIFEDGIGAEVIDNDIFLDDECCSDTGEFLEFEDESGVELIDDDEDLEELEEFDLSPSTGILYDEDGAPVVESRNRIKGRKAIVRAMESASTVKICPSCGSQKFNSRDDKCSVCNKALRAFRAVESFDQTDTVTELELDDDKTLNIDNDGLVSVAYPDDIEAELVEDTHELVLLDDDITITVASGTAELEDGESEVAVLVFEATPEEVRDVLIEDNADGVSVISHDAGFELAIDVITETEFLESADAPEIDEEPLSLEIEEVEGGSLVYSDEIDNIDDLTDLIKDLVPSDVEFNATAVYENEDLDENEDLELSDEDLEELAEDAEDPAESVLESKGKRKVAKKVLESFNAKKVKPNRIKLRKGGK